MGPEVRRVQAVGILRPAKTQRTKLEASKQQAMMSALQAAQKAGVKDQDELRRVVLGARDEWLAKNAALIAAAVQPVLAVAK